MLANYKIESSNYILRIASKDKGRLLLQNKQSETLVQLGELKLGRWPQLELENNCKYEIIEVDGASAIRINYFFSPSVPTSMKLTSTFIVHQDRVTYSICFQEFPKSIRLTGKDVSSVSACPKTLVLKNFRKPNWGYGSGILKEDFH